MNEPFESRLHLRIRSLAHEVARGACHPSEEELLATGDDALAVSPSKRGGVPAGDLLVNQIVKRMWHLNRVISDEIPGFIQGRLLQQKIRQIPTHRHFHFLRHPRQKSR